MLNIDTNEDTTQACVAPLLLTIAARLKVEAEAQRFHVKANVAGPQACLRCALDMPLPPPALSLLRHTQRICCHTLTASPTPNTPKNAGCEDNSCTTSHLLRPLCRPVAPLLPVVGCRSLRRRSPPRRPPSRPASSSSSKRRTGRQAHNSSAMTTNTDVHGCLPGSARLLEKQTARTNRSSGRGCAASPSPPPPPAPLSV